MFIATRAHLEPLLTPGLIDEKWLLLNKYPLPSVEENEAKLIEAAEYFGYQTFDSEYDRGHSASLNNFFASHPQPPGTLLLSIDPDSVTDDAGFDKALCDVIVAEAGIPICALGIPETHPNDPHVRTIAGYRVFVHPSMMMTNIGGADLDLFINGFSQPSKYWGGNESHTYGLLKARNAHLGYLMDYRESRPEWLEDYRDPEYGVWKWAQYNGEFDGSFAEYCRIHANVL